MDASDLVKKIHLYFKDSGSKLCIAESCTGGLISHLLTGVSGASDFFDSSVVGYSTESKIKLLGISRSLIRKHGVISEDAARAMAIAFRKKRKTDFSLSITGNLGPKPMEGKQAGLIYMAIDCDKDTISRQVVFRGRRGDIKYQAAISALRLLCEVLEEWG